MASNEVSRIAALRSSLSAQFLFRFPAFLPFRGQAQSPFQSRRQILQMLLEDIVGRAASEASVASPSPLELVTKMNGVSGDLSRVSARAAKPSKDGRP